MHQDDQGPAHDLVPDLLEGAHVEDAGEAAGEPRAEGELLGNADLVQVAEERREGTKYFVYYLANNL